MWYISEIPIVQDSNCSRHREGNLQIGLQSSQCNVIKFLWLKHIDSPRVDRDNVHEFRFCRVPVGVISSPFLLGATVESHIH